MKDEKVGVELGAKAVIIESNENKTTITIEDNYNFVNEAEDNTGTVSSTLETSSSNPASPVSTKQVYTKSTYESSYSLWSHNSMLYKYNQATQAPKQEK